MYQQVKTWVCSNKLLGTMLIVAALAVASAAWNWYHPKVSYLTKTEYQTVTQEKVVEKIKRVTIPGPKEIVTIEKKVIVEKLGLPPDVANDPNEVITGNADIEPTDGGASVVSVVDTVTGETRIIAKEKQPDLFGFPFDVEIGARYGVSTDKVQQADVYSRWKFLRVGKFYLGAYGEINSKPEAKALLDMSYRF